MDRNLFLALTLSATLQCLAFTPTQATTFAVHLKALKGVANRGAFVKVAAQKSTTEADALFCVYTAALMNQIHQKTPIARIVMLRDFPICVAKDGTIIVALQWITLPGRQAQPVSPTSCKSSARNLVKARMCSPVFPEKFPRVCARNWKSAG